MRHQTDSLSCRARYRNRAVQSPVFCITTIARLSQEEQTRIRRDVHTRQRLNSNRSASAPPRFHKPPTRHSFIYPNTPNNSKHCPLKSFRTSFFNLPFTSFTARLGYPTVRFVDRQGMFSACSTSALRARYTLPTHQIITALCHAPCPMPHALLQNNPPAQPCRAPIY